MLIKFHNLIWEFVLNSDQTREFWCWKLDPFSSPLSEMPTDVYIDLTKNNMIQPEINISEKPVIYSEKRGFFSYSVTQSYDHRMKWYMDRPAKKKRIVSFLISSDWREIKLLEDNSNTNGHLPFEILNQLVPGVFLSHSVIQLHGVLMEYAGNGIVICADSGTGKTTHARLWRDYMHSFIIDGDRATCVREEAGWTAFGIPWCGTSGEYMNRSVPVKAIVVLDRGMINEAHRVTTLEGFIKVLPHLQYPEWDINLANKGVDLLQQLIEDVPVIHLQCLPDIESVEVLNQVLCEL